jgi:hypothetical protein
MKRPVDIGLVPEPSLEEVGVQSDRALRAAPFLYTAQSQLPSPNFTRTFDFASWALEPQTSTVRK